MAKLELQVVEDPEPDPEAERMLDYLSELSRQADTVEMWIGLGS